MDRKAFMFLALVAAVGMLAGCSARTGYDMMRLHQEQRCLELQGADRDTCLQQSGMSYDDYQRHLKEQEQNQ